MIEWLMILLRVAGIGLIALALLHFPIGKQLRWREEARLLAPMNASVFHVHTFFICVVLVMMGLPCVVAPVIFLVPSQAGAWVTWSIAVFWALRLYCQFFVYRADLWRGKRMETTVHCIFSVIWTALLALFTACGMVQQGWLH
ncbi:MAG: hypothetical protein EOP87_03790 [Verrucomicrobiaceae bacterium]|nr:MAG: hypothetical protein EOP87_03790 [Verrucomicrobiaceae bacterium]